jgi:AcrR family transcriptional regulator
MTATKKRKTAEPAPTKPGRRVENKVKTKKAILEAALGLFSKKGFYNTTTKEISVKAGIAEGTLFNYFRTKEDLAIFYFEREMDALIDWFGKNERLGKALLPEKLFAIIDRYFERIDPYKEFIGAVCVRALSPQSKLSPLSLERQQINLKYLRFIRGILAQSEENGEIPPVGELGAYGFGLFHVAMIVHWLHDSSPGKENTLALLDRCLKVASTFLKKGGWEW